MPPFWEIRRVAYGGSEAKRQVRNQAVHACKRLGERVMAKTFERQVTELHIRVALLNRFTQLSRPVTVPVA